MKEKRISFGELSEGITFGVDEVHKLTLLSTRRFRMAGMFFESEKCFLLPIAIPGLRHVVKTHEENPAAKILIVGHTDTAGKDDYNLKLSLERAQAVLDYLHDDAAGWDKHFQDPDAGKKWGLKEIQMMLCRLQDSEGYPFLPGKADGKMGPVTQAAVRAFQKAKGLAVDGDPGPKTRKAIIEAYMDLDGTTLPSGADVTVHGCGEFFPATSIKDGATSPQDRRAEIFFFDEGIKPPPPGPTSKKGSKEYPQWVAGVTDTVELVFADPGGGFDFDLPNQKEAVPADQVLAGEPEFFQDEPILVASNDDRQVLGVVAEAREQHEKRGKDNTYTRGSGSFIPFKLVDKIEAPVMEFDHGFLTGKDGKLDLSKKQDPEFADYLAYMKWDAKVSAAEILRPDLKDATRAYRNFLSGLGFPMFFEYEKYVKEDKAGKILLESAVEDCIAAALEISDVTRKPEFLFQTDPIPVGAKDKPNSRYPYAGTENWQKAIGAHKLWIEAKAKIGIEDGKREFEVLMTIHAKDRYNFNPGDHDIATGIADAENGRFEVTGLGKEFDSTASLRRKLVFEAGLGPVPDFRKAPDGKSVTVPR